MNIRTAIEVRRRKLDRMVLWTDDLTKMLDESKKMDRIIEIYEDRKMVRRRKKDA